MTTLSVHDQAYDAMCQIHKLLESLHIKIKAEAEEDDFTALLEILFLIREMLWDVENTLFSEHRQRVFSHIFSHFKEGGIKQ